ncbi:MAG: magnesium transporter CorA family protein [Gaiellaceae bacterium]
MAEWIDLLDPDRATLVEALPSDVHDDVVDRLLAPLVHDDEPRPRIAGRKTYVFGVLVTPKVLTEQDALYFQEIDFVVTRERVVTVRKTPPHCPPFGVDLPKSGRAGAIVAALADAVAEEFLNAVDALDDEVDELDDEVESGDAAVLRGRIRSLRHHLLRVRRAIGPTREAFHRVVDKRVDVEGKELLPHEVEIAFGDAYDKLLRAVDGLDLARDLLAGSRDYLQARISNDQNDVTKKLTVIASLLLLPTFIVGLYGQNFRHHFPELAWQYGYAWSWFLIVGTTLLQLWFFRRKRWI